MRTDNLLELLFSQSLDGFFFMMLDEPVRWDDGADKEQVLDYVFAHQRVTKVNRAMLAQYGAEEQFLGLTPADLYKHDLRAGRRVWRQFFDRGQRRRRGTWCTCRRTSTSASAATRMPRRRTCAPSRRTRTTWHSARRRGCIR